MKVVFAKEPFPAEVTKTLFLAGPTPRVKGAHSWRKDALYVLEQLGFDGHVFVPEPRDGTWEAGYEAQLEWEEEGLNRADCIVFWVPRDMLGDTFGSPMPGLTTNDEWGVWKDSGKVVWGDPGWAQHVKYQRYYAQKLGVPNGVNLSQTLERALEKIGDGAERKNGECQVPLCIWKKPEFQFWLKSQYLAGNRLEGCRVLWTFWVPPVAFNTSGKTPAHLFMYALHVDVYIGSEDRHKVNEVVLFRTDIASVVLYAPGSHKTLFDTKVVLVKEFRSPVRNPTGLVVELPGGSSKTKEAIAATALHEVEEETGLKILPNRLTLVGSRQIASTLSAHTSTLFAVAITPEELQEVEKMAAEGVTHGVVEDTERTYLDIRRVGDILSEPDVDWSMVGMVMTALFSHQVEHLGELKAP